MNTYLERYALRHIKKDVLLTLSMTSNDGAEFCNAATVSLEVDIARRLFNPVPNSPIWFAASKEIAEEVRTNPPGWYNSGMEKPCHSFKPDELEVVRVDLAISKA